ncbi:hypothetical protein Q1695_003906 [Nippostrongylus brasiliensis]|nr:hypothetical protein Q1695_003906 [Nippostrongylus brasiliensis]
MQLLHLVVCAGLATALPHLGKRTNYDEMLARKLLNMAASAYGEQEEECINRTYPAFEGYKVLSSSQMICDDFNNTCKGYIAASHVTKELLIVFRGTKAKGQLLLEGLYAINPLVKFFDMGSGYRVTITGHSLGGALAALAAARIVKQGFRRGDQITMYTFGEPRVGDHTFATNFDSMIKNSYRVVFRRDLVPHLPACANDQSWFGEREANQTCDVNVKGKPYHHSTEIWYPYSMEPGSSYVECTGQPTGEDFTCSDKIRFYLERLNSYIWDHKHYFTVRVSRYGRFGCDYTQPEGRPGVLENLMCLLSPNSDCEKHKEEAVKHVEVVPSELVNVIPPPSNEFFKKQSALARFLSSMLSFSKE